MSIKHLGGITWHDVREFVNEKVVAIVPLGSVQAHGPHLPLNTDVVISVEIARRAARDLSEVGRDVLVCPPVVFSPAVFARAFPGTIHIPDQTYVSYLGAILEELQGMGVKKAVLATCHLDPRHLSLLHKFQEELPDMFPPEGLRFVIPDLTRKPWVDRLPEEFKNGSTHGGRFETSCMLAVQEEKVKKSHKDLPKIHSGYTRAVLVGKEGFEECGGPEAYFGDPASASVEEGVKLLDILGGIVADAVVQDAKVES